MEVSLSWELLTLLFFIAIAAGFIDTIAGGGGLIALPALLLANVPPLQALATNKLQGTFGTLTSSAIMLSKKIVTWSSVRKAFFMSLMGSALGTLLVHLVDAELLMLLIPVVLISIALYFGLNKQVGHTEAMPRISESKYQHIVVPLIGFYDGFFGPGTGSVFTFANVAFMGKTLIKATANAKCLNFASNIASLCIFIVTGYISWVIGAVMVLGQIVGARLGSHVVLNHGQRWIRPLIVSICVLMCIKLIVERLL